MPTVLQVGPYRFFFFSREDFEPAHIHVDRDASYAKFWLDRVSLARSRGFRSHELTELRNIVFANRDLFLSKWNEHFTH